MAQGMGDEGAFQVVKKEKSGERKVGRIAPMGEAAAQIRKGGRALVREVKSFFPSPEELDDPSLREALLEMEERIEEGDAQGALERLEEGLAPILAGPQGWKRSRRRRWILLGGAILLLLLVAAWAVLRV